MNAKIAKINSMLKFVGIQNFLLFVPDTSILVANWRYKSHDKIQNFSLVSPKLCLLGQNKLGHGMGIPVYYMDNVLR